MASLLSGNDTITHAYELVQQNKIGEAKIILNKILNSQRDEDIRLNELLESLDDYYATLEECLNLVDKDQLSLKLSSASDLLQGVLNTMQNIVMEEVEEE